MFILECSFCFSCFILITDQYLNKCKYKWNKQGNILGNSTWNVLFFFVILYRDNWKIMKLDWRIKGLMEVILPGDRQTMHLILLCIAEILLNLVH